jgi:diguanylate cyclase (GGDEF)-like protein
MCYNPVPMDEFSRLRTGWAFIISLAAFTAVLAILALPGLAEGRILDKGWEILEGEAWIPVKLPWAHAVKSRKAGEMSLRISLKMEAGERLYVPRPRAQYLSVSWKGRKLLEVSNADSPSGNLWNRIHSIEIEESGEGELLIAIAADRTIGLPRFPFISGSRAVLNRIAFANFIACELLYVGMGALFALGLLLVIRSIRRREGLSAGALFGIACLAAIIYLVDFSYFESIGSRTLLFWEKKIAVSSGYASALFYALSAEKFLTGGIKKTRYLAIPSGLSILILMASWTRYFFWNAVIALNLVLLIDMTLLVFILLREDRRGLGLHLPGFFMAFSIIQLLSVFIFNLSLPLVIQYATIVNGLFLGTVMALHPAESERREPETSWNSVRDSLTGLPDRFWLDRVHMRGPGSVAAVGITGFSEQVIRRGQATGDRTIITLAEILKNRLRRSDVILRMEGDVFLVMMESVTEEGALRAMARVAEDFSRLETNTELRLRYSIGPMGSNATDSAEEAIQRLDREDEGSPEGLAPQAT